MTRSSRASGLFLLLLLAWTAPAAAVAFVNSASGVTTVNTATSCQMTLPSVTVGNTNVVEVAIRPQSSTVSSVSDGASTYTRQVAVNNASVMRMEIWAATVAAGASTTVTVTLGAGANIACAVGQYSGVAALGVTATNSDTSGITNPTVNLATQDNNNFAVAGFATRGGKAANAAVTGNFRLGVATSNAQNAGVALNDNTSAVPATVTNTVSVPGMTSEWAAAALELRNTTCAAVSDPSYSVANAQNGQATVYWSSANPVVVVEKTSAFAGEAPTNGTTYSVNQTIGSQGATVRYVGSGTSLTRTSLTNGTTYFYKVFANASNCYSPGAVTLNATPATGTGAPVWSYATTAATMAPPALDPWSGMVVAGSNDNRLHGLTEANGTLGFTNGPFTTGGPIQARPALLPAGWRTPVTAVNIAYAGSQDGYAYAVNTATGAQVWKSSSQLGTTLQGGTELWLQAMAGLTFTGGVTGDVVFVGTSNTGSATNNAVYALNGATGAIVWTFAPGNMDIISSTPQVDYINNAVWVTSRSNGGTQPSVWKLNAANGTLLTSLNSASLGDIDSSPTPSADASVVYVGTNGGQLNAIRAVDGVLLATHTPVNSAPCLCTGAGAIKGLPWPLSVNTIGVATPDTIIFTRNTTVHSVNFDGASFTPNWTTTLSGTPTVSAPVDDGANHLYIGASDGKVHQLDVATGTDQKQVRIPGLDVGFNFRATAGYATDGANETYVVGDLYPTTRNGVTFGWETVTQTTRNRVATNDRRLTGVNQQTNSGIQATFRVDLPATGSYQIHLALGDAGFAQAYQYLQLKDNTTVLLTMDKPAGQPTQHFYDATGTLLTNTTWPTSEAPTTQTFASTILRIVIGTPTAHANSSTLAHLRIVQGAGSIPTVGDPTFNVDLNQIHIGANDGHIYTFATPF